MTNRIPIENAKSTSSQSGSLYLYTLEARINYREGRVINGEAYDNRWKQVPLYKTPKGVGISAPFYKHWVRDAVGMVSQLEAEALRWQFLANAEGETRLGSLRLETRLISHRVKYSYEVTPVEIVNPQNEDGDPIEEVKD